MTRNRLRPEEGAHLGVCRLGEIDVPLPDRPEVSRPKRTHDRICDSGKSFERLSGTDWNRADGRGGSRLLHPGEDRLQGGAGGDAVIDDDHRPTGNGDRRTLPPVDRETALDLSSLTGYLCLDVRVVDTEPVNDVGMKDRGTVHRQRSNGELWVAGSPDLAPHDDVERSVEVRRDLCGDRQPPSRHTEHQDVGFRTQLPRAADGIGEHATGMSSIVEPHEVTHDRDVTGRARPSAPGPR